MFGIGIIVCGKIAQVRHIPEYAAHPEAKLVGFYDINQQRAAELAAKYGGRAYATVEELLAEPEIQAVSICAANFAHAELTIAALNAGKHVLCEKPMATNLADCEAMVQAADANGKFLMIGHNQRLAKAHSLARKLIVEGLIGDIITFRTIFGHGGPETWSIDPGKNTWFFDKKKAAMGALSDLGIHKVDLLQYLTGQKVIETTAKVVTLNKRDSEGNLIGVDDNALCILRMSGGALGTMAASWTIYGNECQSTCLYGTKGIMLIYNEASAPITVSDLEGNTTSYNLDVPHNGTGVIDEFVDALVHDREPEVSGREALTVMRTIFASINSSNISRTVAVNSDFVTHF